jgi:hypothetical protein
MRQIPTVFHTYFMVRTDKGNSLRDNRIENSKYIQHCLDYGTMMESQALQGLKRKLKPKRSRTTVLTNKMKLKRHVTVRGEFGPEIVNKTCMVLYKFDDGTNGWVSATVLKYCYEVNTHWHYLQFHDDEGDQQWLFLTREGTQLMDDAGNV